MMTDKEIIKALECCSKITFSCDGCPLKHLKYSECYELVIRSTLDLINRKQAEIERLCMELDEVIIAKDLLFDEAEALIKKSKAEAVKEFAERLKTKKHECGCNFRKKPVFAVTEEKIDETYKEMVGETNA